MRVSKIIDANNYTVGFVTEYPDHAVIEKTVAYGYELNKELKITELGRLTVFLRNGEQYTFDCWVSTIYCGQFGINVSDDGQYIYVISDEKGLWCYTYKGEIVWKTRYTSVSHVFPHPNHNLTCALTTKLVILDSFGKIIQQTPIWKEGAPYKASDVVIAANTSETIFALFDSMTLEVLHRVSLKKLGLRRVYQPKLCGDLLTMKGWKIGDWSEPVTIEIDLRTHPAVIK